MTYSTYDISLDEYFNALRRLAGGVIPAHSLEQRAEEAERLRRVIAEARAATQKFYRQWIVATNAWIGALDDRQMDAVRQEPLDYLPVVLDEFEHFARAHTEG